MMIEERKNDDGYVGKHQQKEVVIALAAKVPDVDYYRNKVMHYQTENQRLTKENAELRNNLAIMKLEVGRYKECTEKLNDSRESRFKQRIEEYEERIRKLEKALVEASIR